MQDIGLVGVPFSGKSTLFTALTRAGSHGGQANVAVVPVPDPRLARPHRDGAFEEDRAGAGSLRRRPGRHRRARRASRSSARPTRSRWWSAASAPTRAPAEELADVRSELLLADLAVVECALEKAVKRAKGKPGAGGRGAAAGEGRARRRDAAPRRGARRRRSSRHLRAIAPLTLKPEVVIANLEEGTRLPAELGERGRRLRVDRGRDRRDGRRGGPGAARGVRRERAGARAGDRGGLRGARPDHVPHDRRGRDPGVGGAAGRDGARGGGRDPHRPRSVGSSAPR